MGGINIAIDGNCGSIHCRDCWAKLYCSGSCHANSYYASGDIMKPEELFCTMQKSV